MLTAHAGEIDAVDGQGIQTRFFFFIGPIFPLRSVWVTRQSTSRHGNVSVMETEGIELPLQWRSVILGMLRIWAFWAVFIYPFATHYGESVHFGWESPWIECLVLLAVALGLTFGAGRLPKAERMRRRALLAETGLGADPTLLPELSRMQIRFELEDRLRRANWPTDPTDVAARAAGDPAGAPTAYALARYRGVDDPAWKAVVEPIWSSVPDKKRYERPVVR